MKDVIIIGGGPAGMSAALYCQHAGLSVGLTEASVCGGQLASTSSIENYPGILRSGGYELAEIMLKQIVSCGIEPTYDKVQRIEKVTGGFRVCGSIGEYLGRSVIIANGVKRREAGFEGETEYRGHGVSYCATCDGAFYTGRTVCVIGGGNSALEEALYLAGICDTVYIVHRRDTFRADEKYVTAIRKAKNVRLRMSSVPVRVAGDGKVQNIEIRCVANGKHERLDVDGVFVSVGLIPDNVRFADVLRLTSDGYIEACEDCVTSAEGIFACGDTRSKSVRQITTAVADGTVAAYAVGKYLRMKDE